MSPDNTNSKTLNRYNTLLANIYKRFAENNINVLSVPLSQPQPYRPDQPAELEACVVVIEYMYQRPRDDKIIWPKAAISGRTLIDALENAEEIVDSIRSR